MLSSQLLVVWIGSRESGMQSRLSRLENLRFASCVQDWGPDNNQNESSYTLMADKVVGLVVLQFKHGNAVVLQNLSVEEQLMCMFFDCFSLVNLMITIICLLEAQRTWWVGKFLNFPDFGYRPDRSSNFHRIYGCGNHRESQHVEV